MKKMLNLSLIYAIAAMAGGVFYREFTKFNGFSGRTALGFVHTHLFLLGMVMFLLAALFVQRLDVTEDKHWGRFLACYNRGVPLTALLLAVRGVLQVRMVPLTPGVDAALSGIAGIGHILTGLGLIFFLLALRRAADRQTVKSM